MLYNCHQFASVAVRLYHTSWIVKTKEQHSNDFCEVNKQRKERKKFTRVSSEWVSCEFERNHIKSEIKTAIEHNGYSSSGIYLSYHWLMRRPPLNCFFSFLYVICEWLEREREKVFFISAFWKLIHEKSLQFSEHEVEENNTRG